MTVLGITGGIGTGKSYVSRLFQERGIPVYDCDSRAKWLMQNSPDLKMGLTAIVGQALYGKDGVFDGKVMAAALFSNECVRKKVESLVHPAVQHDFELWKAEQVTGVVLMESAILIESGFDKTVDYVIVADAPLELRITRCMARDGASRESVKSRIECQMPQQRKKELGNFVILNDGHHDLNGQVDHILLKCKDNNK